MTARAFACLTERAPIFEVMKLRPPRPREYSTIRRSAPVLVDQCAPACASLTVPCRLLTSISRSNKASSWQRSSTWCGRVEKPVCSPIGPQPSYRSINIPEQGSSHSPAGQRRIKLSKPADPPLGVRDRRLRKEVFLLPPRSIPPQLACRSTATAPATRIPAMRAQALPSIATARSCNCGTAFTIRMERITRRSSARCTKRC
jgi:hypothetical protein